VPRGNYGPAQHPERRPRRGASGGRVALKFGPHEAAPTTTDGLKTALYIAHASIRLDQRRARRGSARSVPPRIL
jgi:hypothetical protein